jgi:hypothetical protein
MKKHVLLASLAVSALAAHGQIVHYNFNETTGAVLNYGSAGASANLTLGGATVPVRTADDAAAPGDSGSFYDASAITDRVISTGASTSSAVTALDSLAAFTITGWFNRDSAAGNLNRILDNRGDPAQAGFALWTNQGGSPGFNNRLEIQVAGGSTAIAGDITPFFADDTWVFFAVTFLDSTDAVQFFRGDLTTASALFTTSSASGSMGASTHPLYVGNRGGNPNRAFDGFLDDIRLYGEVLSSTQIESIRLQGLATQIPEPSTYALLAGIATLGFIALRRRR